MKLKIILPLLFTTLLLVNAGATAGALKPDCGVIKAGKSAAMKATIGVGGRCSPADAAKGSAKDAVGLEDEGRDKGKGRKNMDKDQDRNKDEKNPLKKDQGIKKNTLKKVIK